MAQNGELLTKSGARKYLWIVVVLVIAGLAVGLAAKAGSFLVIDAPRRSDAILVLAGETDRRPQRALELLSQGYGRRVVLDVPNNAKLYEFTQIQLAQKYIHDLPQASTRSASVRSMGCLPRMKLRKRKGVCSGKMRKAYLS